MLQYYLPILLSYILQCSCNSIRKHTPISKFSFCCCVCAVQKYSLMATGQHTEISSVFFTSLKKLSMKSQVQMEMRPVFLRDC